MEKNINYKSIKVFTLILLVNLCLFSFTNAQEVLKLEDGHLPGNGKLEQIFFILQGQILGGKV